MACGVSIETGNSSYPLDIYVVFLSCKANIRRRIKQLCKSDNRLMLYMHKTPRCQLNLEASLGLELVNSHSIKTNEDSHIQLVSRDTVLMTESR